MATKDGLGFDKRCLLLAQESFLRRYSALELPRKGRGIDEAKLMEIVEREALAAFQAASVFYSIAEGWCGDEAKPAEKRSA